MSARTTRAPTLRRGGRYVMAVGGFESIGSHGMRPAAYASPMQSEIRRARFDGVVVRGERNHAARCRGDAEGRAVDGARAR